MATGMSLSQIQIDYLNGGYGTPGSASAIQAATNQVIQVYEGDLAYSHDDAVAAAQSFSDSYFNQGQGNNWNSYLSNYPASQPIKEPWFGDPYGRWGTPDNPINPYAADVPVAYGGTWTYGTPPDDGGTDDDGLGDDDGGLPGDDDGLGGEDFSGYLEAEPSSAYYSYSGEFGGPGKSPKQAGYYQNSFTDIYNDYLGQLGSQVRGGGVPTNQWNDYLGDFDWDTWYRQHQTYEQRNPNRSSFSPQTSWRIPGVTPSGGF